ARLVERAGGVASLPADELEEIEQALEQRLDEWEGRKAIEGAKLAYRDKKDGVTVGLLRGATVGGWGTWTCLTSLRDVEPGINLVLDLDDLGDGIAPAFGFPQPAEVGLDGQASTAEAPA